jgi:SH3-like domain-containing protein
MPLPEGPHAARRDLAELALAGRVFAQHYVEPEVVTLAQAAPVRAVPAEHAPVLATLEAGVRFHILDCGARWAWGRSDAPGTVGYVPVSVLA